MNDNALIYSVPKHSALFLSGLQRVTVRPSIDRQGNSTDAIKVEMRFFPSQLHQNADSLYAYIKANPETFPDNSLIRNKERILVSFDLTEPRHLIDDIMQPLGLGDADSLATLQQFLNSQLQHSPNNHISSPEAEHLTSKVKKVSDYDVFEILPLKHGEDAALFSISMRLIHSPQQSEAALRTALTTEGIATRQKDYYGAPDGRGDFQVRIRTDSQIGVVEAMQKAGLTTSEDYQTLLREAREATARTSGNTVRFVDFANRAPSPKDKGQTP